VPEQFAYLLPPGSRLHARLDAALLTEHAREGRHVWLARCPGDDP